MNFSVFFGKNPGNQNEYTLPFKGGVFHTYEKKFLFREPFTPY